MLIPNSGASSEEEAYLYQKNASMDTSYVYCVLPKEIIDFCPEEEQNILYEQVKPNHKLLKTPSGFVTNDSDNYVFHQRGEDFKEVGNSTYKYGKPNNRHRPISLLTLPKNLRRA